MGKPHDSILLGYYRKLLKEGVVIIPNYKMKELFIASYFPYDSPPVKIEKINGTPKRCVYPESRSTLTLTPAVLLKYIDAGRVTIDDNFAEFVAQYNEDVNNPLLNNVIELRNTVFDSTAKFNKRMCALNEIQDYTNGMQSWRYYTLHYKITMIDE